LRSLGYSWSGSTSRRWAYPRHPSLSRTGSKSTPPRSRHVPKARGCHVRDLHIAASSCPPSHFGISGTTVMGLPGRARWSAGIAARAGESLHRVSFGNGMKSESGGSATETSPGLANSFGSSKVSSIAVPVEVRSST
jgi:hypothetical protein